MKGPGKPVRLGVVAIMMTFGSSVALASGEHEGGHGNANGNQGNTGNGHGHGDGHGNMNFAFGGAASADEADRTVEIVARDTMRFEPSSITVEAGQTVTFRVRNVGQLQHSFTLGSHAYHKQHDREMTNMPADELAHHMKDSPNGMVVQPGQSDTLTWRFEKAEPIEFACHIPGHYPSGMKGQLEINRGVVSINDGGHEH